jgi:protein gp37
MKTGPSAWWDESWNISAGCKPVGPECDNCYAAKLAGTLQQAAGASREVRALYDGIVEQVSGRWVFNGQTRLLPENHPTWNFPLVYPGADHPVLGPGKPSLVFVADMSDLLFRQPPWVIDKVVDTISASDHIGLLLTQRPGRMRAYFAAPCPPLTLGRQLECLWLGFTAGRQEVFNERWSHMRGLAENGWLVFVSIAPLLSAVTLPDDFLKLAKWVIAGGEQGASKDCRDLNLESARRIRDQCANAGVPFFFKQMSRKAPVPIDLMIRQFPRVERTPC